MGRLNCLAARPFAGFDSRTLSFEMGFFSMGSFGGHSNFFSRLVMLLACVTETQI
jgi:hypothetical protein